jgi:hypothetical protein
LSARAEAAVRRDLREATNSFSVVRRELRATQNLATDAALCSPRLAIEFDKETIAMAVNCEKVVSDLG